MKCFYYRLFNRIGPGLFALFLFAQLNMQSYAYSLVINDRWAYPHTQVVGHIKLFEVGKYRSINNIQSVSHHKKQ